MGSVNTPDNTVIRWTIDDFADAGIKFSGAKKLADSQVAPLVAQARGYFTVDDYEGAKAVANRIYSIKDQRTTANRLKTMTNNGNDFMVIPWHSLSDVLRDGIDAASASTQVRPRAPLAMGDGKAPKYETLPGHPSVIDLHPAVPASWADSAVRVLVTEGAIKGDSAVTGQLLAAGVAHDELAAVKDLPVREARERLATLLERIPEPDRVPVFSLIGVGNWHSNPEWNTLNVADKKVLIAFDGDLRENRSVWNQADKMFTFLEVTKKAVPQLLDLGGTNAQSFAQVAGFTEKLGVDDFLSHVGNWQDLLKLVEPTLPGAPESTEEENFRAGDYRVNEAGTAVDSLRRVGTGPESYLQWDKEVVRLGGRIKSVSTLRTVTDGDVEDGLAHDGTVVPSGEGEVVLEITWEDEYGEIVKSNVKGPEILLSLPPSEWAKRDTARIESLLSIHPEWPPRGQKGEGWFSAIKANRAKDIERNEGWDTMGYVPTASGHPVFIVGNTTLGANKQDEQDNSAGVTEERLAKANFYGVKDVWPKYMYGGKEDLVGYKRQVAEDLREIADAFTDGNAWRNPAVGPILLACGLRPTAPTSTLVQLALSGDPGSGKSWSASFLMGFWQSHGGAWNETRLPGTAHDTAAAIEFARMRTPVWVVDDLAPGGNRQEIERQEAAVDQMIRQGFNKAGKRRSSSEGQQQQVAIPRALTVYTMENQRETLSIRQRSVDIRFEKGDIIDEGATRIANLTKRADNPMARLTAAMIRFWLNVDLTTTQLPMMRNIDMDGLDLSTWAGKHQLAKRIIVSVQKDIKELLSEGYGLNASESSRRAMVFSEILFTLDVIRAVGLWAGISHRDPVLKRLAGDPADPKSLHGALVAYAAADLKEFRTKSNSANLITAIQDLLQAGHAHLVNPVSPGERPIPEKHYNSDALNQALGWTRDPARDAWVPRGTPIGFAGMPEKSEPHEWVALLNTTNAFNLAQRHHSNLVPIGQKASASWGQVWNDEGGKFVDSRYARPAERRELSTKIRLGEGSNRLRGIPVKLAALLDGGYTDLVKGWSGPEL